MRGIASLIESNAFEFDLDRLPKRLQQRMRAVYAPPTTSGKPYLAIDEVHHGDASVLTKEIQPNSIALSVWSPPYFVGKNYERHLSFESWQVLLSETIESHFNIVKPGGFLAINIADILCFEDSSMPRIQADVVSRKRVAVTKEDILAAIASHPDYNRHKLAKLLNCSEQTIDRRLNGNNIRGGKYDAQTRVKLVGGLIEEWALKAGFYPYDRRIWVKDPAWENSRWSSLSYRSIDEFEYIYIFWKPGITKFDRARLTSAEWKEWGSRAVWQMRSVRKNDDHEAKFPLELPKRCIQLLTDPGDIILDCFMGSGTTAIAALQTRRHFIGIERESAYVNLSRMNIRRKAALSTHETDSKRHSEQSGSS